MAVLPDALLAVNGGRIEASLFPSETEQALEFRLEQYLAEGTAKASAFLTDAAAIDVAATEWAYHRAFDAVFIRLSSQAASVQLNDQGSKQFLVTQIQNFKDLSDAALLAYEEAIQTGDAESPTDGFNVLSSVRH